jgi:hypothetical protein
MATRAIGSGTQNKNVTANECKFHEKYAGMQNCGMCKDDGQKTVIWGE